MMDSINTYSGISRGLDPHYRSNRLIVAATVAVFIASFLAHLALGKDWFASGLWAFNWAGAVFLAWILAREIDPDNLMTSAIAPTVTVLGLAVFNWQVSLIALTSFIVVVRVMNRITGAMPTVWDNLFELGVVIWAAMGQFWLVGIAVALGYGFESRLDKPYPQALRWAGIYGAVTLAVAAIFDSFKPEIALDLRFVPIMLGLIFWHLLVLQWMPMTFTTLDDRFGKRLNRNRMVAGQTLLLLGLGLVLVWRGIYGVEGLWALLITVVSFLGYQTYLKFKI